MDDDEALGREIRATKATMRAIAEAVFAGDLDVPQAAIEWHAQLWSYRPFEQARTILEDVASPPAIEHDADCVLAAYESITAGKPGPFAQLQFYASPIGVGGCAVELQGFVEGAHRWSGASRVALPALEALNAHPWQGAAPWLWAFEAGVFMFTVARSVRVIQPALTKDAASIDVAVCFGCGGEQILLGTLTRDELR
jgi:hypothetical protein